MHKSSERASENTRNVANPDKQLRAQERYGLPYEQLPKNERGKMSGGLRKLIIHLIEPNFSHELIFPMKIHIHIYISSMYHCC